MQKKKLSGILSLPNVSVVMQKQNSRQEENRMWSDFIFKTENNIIFEAPTSEPSLTSIPIESKDPQKRGDEALQMSFVTAGRSTTVSWKPAQRSGMTTMENYITSAQKIIGIKTSDDFGDRGVALISHTDNITPGLETEFWLLQ